jgi:hypothetical protein
MYEMKTIYIAIFSGSTIAMLMLLAFMALYSYDYSNEKHSGPIGAISPMQLELKNIVTEPEILTVGNTFQIYATINNTNLWPITFHDGCTSPLTISFDKNVQIKNEVGCYAMSNDVVNPGQMVRVHGPSSGVVYNATAIGNTNATVTFSYQNQGNDINITTFKQILIEPPATHPTLEEQLGLAKTGINATVYHNNKPSSCPSNAPCFNPLVYYLVMSSKSKTFLLTYNICDGDSCVNEDANVMMLENVGSIVRLPDKHWTDGDFVDIQVQLPRNGSLVFDKNSTYDPVHTPKIWVDLGKSKIVGSS